MPMLDTERLEFDKLPPLTDAQVQAGARPGESWEQARQRLEAANFACPPVKVVDHPGADYTAAGPLDECEGPDGQPIQWEPGELGFARYP
ncbi:hypothetical protein [Serratia proteamaculans]|uniref:hypothetical protein n=1 Tax=Serratia proteamaculans TaxID=28151 RepID=UPI003D002214